MKTILKELVSGIHNGWKGGSRDDFAILASEVMERTKASTYMNEKELLSWLASDEGRPEADYTESDAGEPTIVVHRDDLLRVEVIQWLKPIAINHNHLTPGCFGPIAGERINLEYERISSREATPGVNEIYLKPKKISLIGPGDVVPIYDGFDRPHTLFFISPRCLTLTVRLRKVADTKGQNYIGRRFSFNTQSRLDMLRRLQILDSVRDIDLALYERSIIKAAKTLPVVEAMKILYDSWSSGNASTAVAEIVSERANIDTDLLIRNLDEDYRQLRLGNARDLYDDPAHRMVLGALWASISRRELDLAWAAIQSRHKTMASFPDNLIDMMGLAFVTERTQPSTPMGIHPDAETESDIRNIWSNRTIPATQRLRGVWSLSPLVDSISI